VLLLTVGLAAAAWLQLGRPLPLKASDREIRVPHPPAASVNRQDPAQEKTVSRETAVHQENTVHPKEVAHVDVEPVAGPPKIPRNIKVMVPPGTEIRLALDTAVGSSSSHAGDPFTARITDPVIAGDRVAIPAGSRVHGRVGEAIPAKKGLSDKGGSLTLSFDRVMTQGGLDAPMSAAMTSVAPKSGKKTAGIIGGSAAGGALLGKILGGNSKKAAVGSVVGGAIGAGIAAGTKGDDVEFPAGSPLTIKLDQPLTISIHP